MSRDPRSLAFRYSIASAGGRLKIAEADLRKDLFTPIADPP